MNRVLVLTMIGLLGGCFAPPGPMERLTNAAYELNSATRFGRMDVALSLVAADAQVDFMQRHADWHSNLRVVDVELRGLRLLTKEMAEVQLAVAWHSLDNTTIQTSVIAQKWTHDENGWAMAEEARVSGSPGIFRRGRSSKPREEQRNAEPAMPGAMDAVTVSGWE